MLSVSFICKFWQSWHKYGVLGDKITQYMKSKDWNDNIVGN